MSEVSRAGEPLNSPNPETARFTVFTAQTSLSRMFYFSLQDPVNHQLNSSNSYLLNTLPHSYPEDGATPL